MGSADDLSSLLAYTRCLHVGITSYGLPFLVVSSEDSSDDSSTAGSLQGSGVVLFARVVMYYLVCLCFTGQPRTVQEYVGVGVQSPAYLGFRPADGLSVVLEGWTMLCRIASVGHSLTRCTPPWRSVRCSGTEVHPCREDQSIRIALSTVTGRFMLKLDLTITNYYY